MPLIILMPRAGCTFLSLLLAINSTETSTKGERGKNKIERRTISRYRERGKREKRWIERQRERDRERVKEE